MFQLFLPIPLSSKTDSTIKKIQFGVHLSSYVDFCHLWINVNYIKLSKHPLCPPTAGSVQQNGLKLMYASSWQEFPLSIEVYFTVNVGRNFKTQTGVHWTEVVRLIWGPLDTVFTVLFWGTHMCTSCIRCRFWIHTACEILNWLILIRSAWIEFNRGNSWRRLTHCGSTLT